MQPSMKKVHSVDYTGQRQQQQQQPFDQSIRSIMSGGGANGRNASLMHSVSIVVELASEGQSAGQLARESSDGGPSESETCDLHDRAEAAPSSLVEDEEEEEAASEAASECLSSELARKVVIVDEADKIFLWNRAQSAEPKFDLSAGDEVSLSPKAGASCGLPPRRLATLRSHTINYEGQPECWWPPTCSGPKQQPLAGGRGSSGELAERGELSKLSMRRYTHHQVQYAPALNHSPSRGRPPGSPRASPLSAQAESKAADNWELQPRTISHSLAGQLRAPARASTPTAASCSGLLPKNLSHRRQSLQISLLSGVSSALNKSLTEEELRGEREFNEQVRILRSPELFSSLQHQHRHQSLSLNTDRCHSVASATGAEPANQEQASFSGSSSQVDRLSSDQQLVRQPHSQRRVSFSSIDSVLIQPEPARTRASIAYHPTKRQQLDLKLSGAIGERAARLDASSLFKSNLIDSLASGRPQLGCLKSSKLKRHSLASPFGADVDPREGQLHKQRNFAEFHHLKNNPPDECSQSSTSTRDSRPKEAPRKLSFSYDTASRSMTSPKNTVSTSAKMNDNIISREVSRIDSLGAQEQTVSATLEGRDIDDPRVTSSTTSATLQANAKAQAKDASKVQSIMANARLRQEEFARLLEEHEQIVNEIHRVETKISSSQTNLQQQQQEENK